MKQFSRCQRRKAGSGAAFEILTELPIDWDKAARMQPQPDEPWNRANQRQPDMILTAENGWSFGEHGYGEDKKTALQEALNEHLIGEGKEPIDWTQPEGASGSSSPAETGDPPSSDRSSAGAPDPIRGKSRGASNRSGPRLRSL